MISQLESVRGLAAIIVVIFHLPAWNSQLFDVGFIRNGYLMVDIFFVLSGYVISNAYLEKINSRGDLIRFQLLRFGRLYPAHFLFLLLFLFLEVVKYILHIRYGIAGKNSDPFVQNNIGAFIQQLLLVQAIGPTSNSLTFNGPAWSISVEFFTYLIFAFLLLNFRKVHVYLFGFIALCSIALLVSESAHGFDDLLRCFSGFFIGCLSRRCVSKFKSAPLSLAFLSILLLLLFLVIKRPHEYDVLIYFLSSAMIITIVLQKDGWLKSLLESRFLVFLGSISYSVYMSHALVILLANQFVRYGLNGDESIVNGVSVPQLSVVLALSVYFVVFVALIIVSTIVYKYVEVPLRQKMRSATARYCANG